MSWWNRKTAVKEEHPNTFPDTPARDWGMPFSRISAQLRLMKYVEEQVSDPPQGGSVIAPPSDNPLLNRPSNQNLDIIRRH